MSRTSGEKVKQIIDTNLSEGEITPFITAANLLVTDLLLDEDYSDDLLAQIERWLAAHFVAVRDPQVKDEGIGGARMSYEGAASGEGLKATRYGQQAIVLDRNGILAYLGKQKAEIKVIDIP